MPVAPRRANRRRRHCPKRSQGRCVSRQGVPPRTVEVTTSPQYGITRSGEVSSMRQLYVGTAIVLALALAAPVSAQVPRRGVPGAQPPAATAPIPPPPAPAAQPAPAAPPAQVPAQTSVSAPPNPAPQPSAAAPSPSTTARLPGAAAVAAAPAGPRPRRARPVRAVPEAGPTPREAAPAVSRRTGRPADYIASRLNRQELERLPSGGGMPPTGPMAPAESPAPGEPPYPWRGYGTAGSW